MNQANDGGSLATEPARPQVMGGRNMRRMIGLGCFGVLVMGCLFIVGVFVVVNVAMRSSDAYQLALAAAQRDPAVIAELGGPVRAGWFTTGELRGTDSNGEASLEIPISGSRRSGTIAVRANKSSGTLTFSHLHVRISGRATPINLLPATTP